MKQVLQNRSSETIVREVPSPPVGLHDVLVRNAFSAISSGTERARIESKSLLERGREQPELVREVATRALRDGVRETAQAVRRKLTEESAAGYSSAGVVLEVGPRVRGFSPGDRVACAGAGHANHAELVTVPENLCAHVPDGVDLRAAAVTTIAAIALHGVRVADVRLGERVAVVGCGLVGQITCRLLTSAGAEVFALDLDAVRVERAIAAGADHGFVARDDVVREMAAHTGGAGLDHVLVTAAASSPEPLHLALEATRERGSVTLVGDVPIEMPREPLYLKELSFRVSRSYGPGRYDSEYEERGLDYPIGYVRWTEQRNMDAVLDLQGRGRLELADLIEETVPVGQAAGAYARLAGPVGDRPFGAIVLDYGKDVSATRKRAGKDAPHRSAASGIPRVGLIGPGGFARQVLIPAFVAAGARLELVGGGAGPSAEQAVRELGFGRYAASVDELIHDPAVDIVVIANRHGEHASLAQAALKAGKHVFCEKPLALTDEELDATLEAARSSDGVLAVGFNRRFSPWLRQLAEFGRSAAGPITVLYRVSAGELPHDHWQNDPRDGGGRILGEGCHFIDSIRFLSGHDIVTVYTTGHSRTDLSRQSLDNVVMSLECADGSVGSVTYVASSSPRVGKERVELFGAAGIGVLDDYQAIELHHGDKVQRRRKRSQNKGHHEEIGAFIQGVRNGTCSVPLDEIENASRATLAAVQSLCTGQRISLRGA